MPLFKFPDGEPVRIFQSRRELRQHVARLEESEAFLLKQDEEMLADAAALSAEIDRLNRVIDTASKAIVTLRATIEQREVEIELRDAKIEKQREMVGEMLYGHETGTARRCKKCNCNAPCRTVQIAAGVRYLEG